MKYSSVGGNYSIAGSRSVPLLGFQAPITVTLIPGPGNNSSCQFLAAGQLLPIQGLTSVTVPTSITLPSMVRELVFTVNSGTSEDAFEVTGN